MYRLNLTEHHEVVKNGQNLVLNQPTYNVTDENFLKENNFIKCWKCKEYFDVTWEFGEFHPKFEQYEGHEFCKSCFTKVGG